MKSFKISNLLGIACICSLSSDLPGKMAYDDAKASVVQWAETKSLISKELSQWDKDKAILEDLAAMLEVEKEDLREKIEVFHQSATEADLRRAELMAQRDLLETAALVVRANIGTLENEVRSLIPYLPNHYKESLEPLLRQLPTKDQPTQVSLAVRLRNVISILSQASKFDSTISLESETRQLADGAEKQVDTLYLGLAIAYYADPSGTHAGYGFPTPEGWRWESSPAHSNAIRNAIDMYQKGKQAEFVTLPVVVQ